MTEHNSTAVTGWQSTTPEPEYSIMRMPDRGSIIVMFGGREGIRIGPDGAVTLGEGVTPEHAAHEFYQALLRMPLLL